MVKDMTLNTVYKIAEELNMEVEYKRYGYWNDILHIGNTAMAFFVQGSMCSVREIDEIDAPAWCTKQYVKDCIIEGTNDLGWINLNYRPFEYGSKKWNPSI